MLRLKISIHAPLAGCDRRLDGLYGIYTISIHAPLAGCDKSSIRNSPPYRDFNPRTPCGVRLFVLVVSLDGEGISIHAPLAGCDRPGPEIGMPLKDFNPRTPCGVRLPCRFLHPVLDGFQSTHPLRGATVAGCGVYRISRFQSTHPLRGATTRIGLENGS